MKAKLYIAALSAVILSVLPAKANSSDKSYFSNGGTEIVINNYYGNSDYHYASRINRFHRSYASFDYYSPVYTDVYWYTYQPFTWGVSIYGGGGLGFGFAVNYPVYYSDWRYPWYDYDWYNPYYRSSWYWGYDPYYYSWSTPAIININIGYRWRYNHWWRNDYRAWNMHNYWWRNNYRPFQYNRYYASGYSSRDYYDRDRRYSYNRDLRSENSVRSSGPSQRIESGKLNDGGVRSGSINRRPAVNSSESGRSAVSQNRGSSSSGSPVASQNRSSSSRSPVASQRRSSPSGSQVASQSRSSSSGSPVASQNRSSSSGSRVASQSRSSSSGSPVASQNRSSSSTRGTAMSHSRSSSPAPASKSAGSSSRSSSSRSSGTLSRSSGSSSRSGGRR